MAVLGFIALGVGLVLGMPLFLTFVLQSVIHVFGFVKMPMMTIPQLMFTAVDHYSLLAVVFFILAGFIMRDAGLSVLLVDMVNTWIGHVPGGLAWVMTLTTGIFGALTGSPSTAIAAVGLLMVPRMVKAGYPRLSCVSMMASLASLGVLIPPSNSLILYGTVTETSVAVLFIAGLVPGIIYMLVMGTIASFIVWLHARRGEYWGKMPKCTWRERSVSFYKALPVLTFPVVILGGIYGGFFSPIEAARVATFFAVILALCYRHVSIKRWRDTCKETLRVTGMLFFLLSAIIVFARVMAQARIPHELTAWLVGLGLTKAWFIFAIIVAYIVIGFVTEAIIIIVVTTPILYPTVIALGIDPIQFGVFVTSTAVLASCTPPVGGNVFNASAIFYIPVADIFAGVVPFVIGQVAVLFMVAYWPPLSLWLPRLGGLM